MSDARTAWGVAWGSVAASALVLVVAPRASAGTLKSTDALAVSVGFLAVAGALLTSARWNSEQAAPASVPPPPPAWNLEEMVERAVERRRRKYNSQVDVQERPQEKEPRQKKGGAEETGQFGFSMEDARQLCEDAAAEADARTPGQVLADLQRGNTRFWMGTSNREADNAFQRRALIVKQFPKVAVLGCSDSRVPIELVFDQGLGGIFAIRVAGNVLDMSTTGSLEYAVHHLKVKVVVVMGHEFCGAVKAALAPVSDEMRQSTPSLGQLVGSIHSGLDGDRLSMVCDQRARDREAVVVNVKRQIDMIRRDKAIMKSVASGELIVVGAFYEISSGIVDFFEEVAVPATETRVSARDRTNSRSHIALPESGEVEPETY
jgi:carbonic anhydrase